MKFCVADLPLWLYGGVTLGATGLSLVFATGYALGGLGALSEGWTTAHVQVALSGPPFWIALAYSLALAAATLVLSLSLALGLMLGLRQHLRRPPLSIALVLPLAVPPIVAALMVDQWLGSAGLLARLSHALGLIDSPSMFPALVHDRYGIGIVVAQSALVAPFFALLFDRLAEQERLDTYGALARTLGATPAQTLRRVTIPLLLRGARPLIAVYGVVLVGAYEIPLLIGVRYPAVLTVEIEQQIAQLDLGLRPQGFAMAATYLLLVLLVLSVMALLAWQQRDARR